MTTVTIYKSDQDNYKGFTCNGHAGYAKFGKDIVCASISMLVINTINSLEQLSKDEPIVNADDRTGYIDCKFDHEINGQSKLLLDSMILGLKSIAEQYGEKFLRLKFEEV